MFNLQKNNTKEFVFTAIFSFFRLLLLPIINSGFVILKRTTLLNFINVYCLEIALPLYIFKTLF